MGRNFQGIKMFSMKIFSMKILGEENPGEEFTMRRKFRHENSIDIIVVQEYSIDPVTTTQYF